MARLIGSAIGNLSGKIGNVVASYSNGRTTIRAAGYRNPSKVSEGQQIHRERFKIAKQLVSRLSSVLNVGFREICGDAKIQNVVFKQLFTPEIILSTPRVEVDYSRLFLSKGTLTDFHEPNFSLVNRTLTFSWVDNSSFIDCDSNDEVFLVVIFPEIDKFQIVRDVYRSSESILLSFSPFNRAKEAHCYLFIASAISESVTETLYFKIEDIGA